MPYATFRAGARLTAGQLKSLQPTYVIKTANETVTNSTTLQNDDELKVSLEANSRYHVRIKAMFDTNGSAGPDIQTDWTLPTGATLNSLKWVFGPDTASTNRNATSVRQGVHAHNTAVSYGSGETTPDLWINLEEEFTIDTVGSGTLQFRWAQQSLSATATEIRAGSFIRAELIG